MVKELALRTGISKHTLDNYLNVNNYMPSAENAVKIAGALGVTAEKLVLGEAAPLPPDFPPEIKDIAAAACELDTPKRRALLAIARELKKL